MRLHSTKLILLIITLLNTAGISQPYNVTIENKPYASLENAQEIDAYNVDYEWPVFQIPIGFEFPFFDITSNMIYSNARSFGGYTSLNQNEDDLYMLVHFFANFIERGDSQGTTLSPIRYKTEGTSPNRIFTLEYNDMGFFFGLQDVNGTYLDYINIQIRLYEGSGNIEFHIGPYVMNEDPDEVFDALSGPFIGILSNVQNTVGGDIGEVISISGDINDPVISDDPFAFMDWPIPENTVFKFQNLSTAVSKNERINNLRIFPNPVTDNITIQSEYQIDQIKIMNVIGQQVYSTTNSQFDINHLRNGLYYLKISIDDKEVIHKIMKL